MDKPVMYYTCEKISVDTLKLVYSIPGWLKPIRWLLKKLGYEIGRWGEFVDYETITFEPKDIESLVREQYRALYTMTGNRPKSVILGHEQQLQPRL